MVQDFKKFIAQGNVLDLAVGVIIAFVLFMVVRSANKFKQPEIPKPAV